MNKKIAVIVAGINETYQSSILRGIQAVASECSFDCYIFASFTGLMDNKSHDFGEMNIFKLPDFNSFDGAVLLTNTIDYQPAVTDILKRIMTAGIPAVSIDNDVPGLLHIGIDNSTAMREITEHFIKVHGFTEFNYISGPVDNPESADRLAAFLGVLEEHGLTIDEDRIFYGDFRGASGKAAIEYFLCSGDKLPQAIICANDVMAAAAVNRLYEAGYNIPNDIAISGFDNVFNNHNLRVELTSVDRPLLKSGRLACEMLFNKFNSIPQANSKILNMSPRFAESCGCKTVIIHDANEYKEMNITNYSHIETMNNFMAVFNRLACKLNGANTFDDYIESMKQFIEMINPDEFYFCLNETWDSQFIEDNGNIRKTDDIPTAFNEGITIPIAYCNGDFVENINISLADLIPKMLSNKEDAKFYYFLPLHFGERCLGYMVINNSPVSLHNVMFQSWCITVNNSLENIRKLNALNYAVRKLGTLYAQDTFSGIYNRNGFVLATTDVFRSCAENARSIMLMFLDLDDLKKINDTFGHAVGDEAIRAVADVLTRSCTGGEIFCRFGGDEFIVFAADYTDEDARNLTAKIQENIVWVNKSANNSYELSASTGYVIAVPKMGEDLFLFVTEADKIMYETKRKKKKSKHLR